MEPWNSARLTANGIEIHYLRTGGDRPPVVLLHGLTDNAGCWSRLARDLAPDYDLIMPDARGHGLSAAPEQGYAVADRLADLAGLIDALQLDRPALLGHSMGGLTAAAAAAAIPERIRGVILEDPAFISPEAWRSDMLRQWPLDHQATLQLSEAELIAQGQALNPQWVPDTFVPWARAKLQSTMHVFKWFDGPPDSFRDLVARFAVPALLITGDIDRGAVVSPELAAELHALSPRLRLAHFAGVGHCIRYERPEQYAELVRGYLAELYGAA